MNHFIVEFQQAFSRDYCQHLIQRFEQDQRKVPGRTGGGVDKSKKDSEDLYLSELDDWAEENKVINDLIMRALIQYARGYPFLITGAITPSFQDHSTGEIRPVGADDVASMNDAQLRQIIDGIFTLDDVNFQKYRRGSGGYHHWHSEHFPHPSDPNQGSLHRVLLWLIYLNDVEQGGETEFYFQQAQLKPRAGSLVLAPCGFTHTHRGSIPRSSDKYVLASWVRYKDARSMYGQAP